MRHFMRTGFACTVRPELVEGLFFSGHGGIKKGQGFDKLSPNGLWGQL
jgi:hypothetical protein